MFISMVTEVKEEVFEDFSFQFRKIITRYRRIGFNLIVSLVFSHLGFWSGNLFLIAPFPDLCLLVPLNVMRQSACLVFNPIMVDNYAAFFNCTPVGRASDSMMAPT